MKQSIDMAAMIAAAESGRELILLTVLDGDEAGQKLLIEEGSASAIENGTDGEETDSVGGFLLRALRAYGEVQQTRVFSFEGRRIFAERFGGRPELVLCGAGHVALALIRLAATLDFRITVIEDRPEFAEMAEKAGADQVYCGPFGELLRTLPDGSGRFYVVMTRGHRYDLACLGEIFRKPFDYVGMMGSRRRAAIVRDDLLREGIPAERAAELHAPIGLSIGAETPEEIAVSVAAELIRIRSEKRRSGFSDPKLCAALSDPADLREKILCTITERHGSAPRGVGTKMLVLGDGSTIGTIGGGCAEYAVIRRCRTIFALPIGEQMTIAAHGERMTVDMNDPEAADGGMACGGSAEVLLEWI